MADSVIKATGSYCGPCYSDKREVSAVNWCIECDEAICTDCTKNHSLYKPLRSHHLVDIKLKTSHSILDDISDTKCGTHEGREIEYFCTDHDQIFCRDCLAKTHKACENTISLESASENIKRSGIISDYNDRLEAILDTASNLAENRRSNSNGFMQECQKIKDKIRQTKQHLIARLHEMETDMLEKLQKITKVRTSNFEKEKEDATKIKEKVESYKEGIAFCHDHVSNKNTFIFIRKLDNRLQHAETGLEKIISSCRNVSIDFKESGEIGSHLKSLGTIDVKEDQCTVKYTSPKQRHAQIPTLATKRIQSFELKHIIDMSDKVVTGLTITDDNKILLCDRSASYGILVYNEQNAFVKEIKTSQQPWDIAVVRRENKVVVTFPKANFIQFIDTNSLTCDRMVDMGVEVIGGVATTTDKILIGGTGKIYVLNNEGDHLQTLSVCGGGVNYISVDIDDTKYYYSSDWKSYFCVNENGNQIFSYKIEGETEHRDIETDSEGNICIVGRTTNTIQRLHPDGSFDCVILDKNNGIKQPLAICFNRNRNKLYVSNFGGRKLLVFDCK